MVSGSRQPLRVLTTLSGYHAVGQRPLRLRSLKGMRRSDFWSRMYRLFGEAYAESFAQDFVLAELGSRTVRQALAAGYDAKDVWRAVCEEMKVPLSER